MLLPFFPFVTGLTLSNTSVNKLYFVCSRKSECIFRDKKETFGFFGARKFILCKPRLYFQYLVVIFYFIKKFKFNFWFYPEIAVIPDMIRLHEYLNKKNYSEINITNQYDRWSLFISRIINDDANLNLYQHGILRDDIIPIHKIKKVNNLYCYDNVQKHIFTENIIENVYKIIIKKPKIKLDHVSSGLSILICGTSDSYYKNVEIELIEKLSSIENILLCYKPHPLSDHEPSDYDLMLIDKNSYPKVNFMIHIASTLKMEYENSDPSVSIFDATILSVDEINKNIREKIKLLTHSV